MVINCCSVGFPQNIFVISKMEKYDAGRDCVGRKTKFNNAWTKDERLKECKRLKLKYNTRLTKSQLCDILNRDNVESVPDELTTEHDEKRQTKRILVRKSPRQKSPILYKGRKCSQPKTKSNNALTKNE